MKLVFSVTNNNDFLLASLGFHMEEIEKDIKIGLEAQKGFTQVHEDRSVKNGHWGQVVYLNSPVEKKTREEIRNRDNESAFKKRNKTNDFVRLFVWTTMSQGRVPLNHHLKLKKTFDVRSVMGFGALTRLSPIIMLGTSFSFPLEDFMGAMRKSTSRFVRMHLGAPLVFKEDDGLKNKERTGRNE